MGCALLAPILPLDDPNDTLGGTIASKGFGAEGHLLGGDSSGRDPIRPRSVHHSPSSTATDAT